MTRFVLCTALLLVTASCGDDAPSGGSGGGAESDDSARAPEITSLEQVDTSQLGASERRLWAEIVNDLNSPCGEPVSIARCVKEQRGCRSCVPAARYLARLASEGLRRTELREAFQARYGGRTHHTIDLADTPVQGAPMARVTLVEFADFECPHCGVAHRVLERIVSEFEGQVRFAFKYFPLSSHEHAIPAATAAAAADLQGKFWPMHDLLFRNQMRLEPQDIERYAQQIGLDMARFRADRESETVRRRIEQDLEIGRGIGVTGTPMLFVNGRKYPGAIEADGLRAYIREELDQ